MKPQKREDFSGMIKDKLDVSDLRDENDRDVKKVLSAIQDRNRRVEADKAWEISKTRRIIVAIFIYIFAVIFLLLTNTPNPFVNSLIPALAYILSTLTLPLFKQLWINNKYK